MDPRKIVIRQTLGVALGELICCGAMVCVFAALGLFRLNVLWGALAGGTLMTANHFFMAMAVSLAADRAQDGKVRQARQMVQVSSVVRLAVLAAALIIGVKLGANVVAMVLPLAFVRPILMVGEFFGKKGD